MQNQKSASFVKKASVFGALAVASVGSAFAALPTSVATTVTDIGTNAQGIFDLIFPVVGTVLGLVIVIKLFKKFTSKI